MPGWSPYSFSFDNPLRYIDIDGLAPLDIFKQTKDGGYVRISTQGGNNMHTYINNNGTTSYYNVKEGTMRTVSNQAMQGNLTQYQENKKQFKASLITGTLKAAETMQKTGDDISKASGLD